MIKKIGLIIFGILLFCVFTASAARIVVSDFINGVVTIEGHTAQGNQTVNILVLQNGTTQADAQLDFTKVQYQGEITSDSNGNYKKSFTINVLDVEKSQELVVYLGEEGTEVQEPTTIFFAPFKLKLDLAKSICGTDLQAPPQIQELSEILSRQTTRKILALNIDIIENADMNFVATMLRKSLIETPISFSNEEAGIIALQALIKEISLIDCYNQRKTESIFGANYDFYEMDMLQFANLSNGVDAYLLYTTALNHVGKSNVMQSLTGNNIASLDMLRKLFVKSVIFHGISYNNDQGGYGHIKNYITQKNANYCGLSLGNYFNLSDSQRENINAKLVSDTSITFQNFEGKIRDYSNDIPTPTYPSGDSGGKKLGNSNTTVIGSLPVATEQQEKEIFDDLQDVSWAKEAILTLKNKNIINGVSKDLFQPNGNLTREQAVKIICLAFQIPTSNSGNKFLDVSKDAWYAQYLATANDHKMINGLSDTIFGVGYSITREDFAVMIYRAAKLQSDGQTETFTDYDKISDYAKEAVSYFKKEGIINGYEDGAFKPKNNISRAEASMIIFKLMEENNHE